MNNKITITLWFLSIFMLSNLTFAAGGGGGNPYFDIRIYCEYHDKAQNKDITFKLLNDDKSTVKVQRSMFIRHLNNSRYRVTEPRYSELVETCKKKIAEQSKGQGEFIRLKGTNAGNYESLTMYYPVLNN